MSDATLSPEARDVLEEAIGVMAFGLTPGCGCSGCERRRVAIVRACDLLGRDLPSVLTDNGAEQEHAAPLEAVNDVESLRPWWDQPGIPGPVD